MDPDAPLLAGPVRAHYERLMAPDRDAEGISDNLRRRAPDLCTLLAQYEPADALESAHLERMRGLCESVADPFSRRTFEPGHFTASAFIISPDGDELLLILHQKLGRWLQPGGHVDPSDLDVLAAARREAREEVGMTNLELVQPAPLDLDVHDIPARKDEPRHAHFDVRFLLRARSREFAAGSDAKEARWVRLTALSDELSDRSVMRAVEKLRACRG